MVTTAHMSHIVVFEFQIVERSRQPDAAAVTGSVPAMGGAARYIALEGAEGCGKSTHAALLATAIGAVLTRETGGTAIGRRIREILHDNTVTDLADRAEA